MIKKNNSLILIIFGLLVTSIGFNILQFQKNIELKSNLLKRKYYIILILERLPEYTLTQGGVKASTTISELYKQVVVDRPATLKVD